MEELNAGEIVYLKSGGPAMTILYLTENEHYFCSWFEGKKEQRKAFSKESLTKTDPEDTKPAPQLGKV